MNDRTSKRVELALQDAVEDDRNFAIQLREAVSELQAMQQSDTPDIAAGRDVIQQTGAGTMIVHTGSGNLNSSPQDGEVGE
ncbi:hypothetical protein [Glycomyces salinus]|uniref:hypothetical protein n=1 Tax=Glycomyces salinus TaxID=980294 RepID=UPI0018EB67CF|nr:hypothetical protein [Glycomyces salinus]